MKRKGNVAAALAISAVGTLVLYLLGKALFGLIGTTSDIISCAVGAFLSTFIFHRLSTTEFKPNLRPAALIVFATFVSISVGHAIDQVCHRHVAVDFEPIGKLIWAIVATSWFLIPLCSLLLTWLNKTFGLRSAD